MDRHTFFSGTAERVNFSSTGVITCGGTTINGACYVEGWITTDSTSRIGIGISPSSKLHVSSGSTSTGNKYQKYNSVFLNDQTLQWQTLTDV
jgi:hypothetical protein